MWAREEVPRGGYWAVLRDKVWGFQLEEALAYPWNNRNFKK